MQFTTQTLSWHPKSGSRGPSTGLQIALQRPPRQRSNYNDFSWRIQIPKAHKRLDHAKDNNDASIQAKTSLKAALYLKSASDYTQEYGSMIPSSMNDKFFTIPLRHYHQQDSSYSLGLVKFKTSESRRISYYIRRNNTKWWIFWIHIWWFKFFRYYKFQWYLQSYSLHTLDVLQYNIKRNINCFEQVNMAFQ